MKTVHRFSPVLLAACFVSTPAIAQEDLDDRLLINCEFRPRDSTTQADGTYKVAFVSGLINAASGVTDDLRLMNNNTAPASRRRFTMLWHSWNSTHGNQWLITPDYAAKCMTSANGFVHASTCDNAKQRYLTMNDGYYVISGSSDLSNSWQAPANANSIDYVTRATFSASAGLATRRRFHWRITGCTDMYGNGTSPAP